MELNNIFNSYCEEVGQVDLLTREEERELAIAKDEAETQKERDEARERLIVSNLRFVIKIAKNYQHLGLDFLDLINEGNIGLMRAVKGFNPNAGAKLSTYSSWWIRQSITKALSEDSRLIRLPTYLVQKTRTVASYVENYQQEHNEPPTPEQISEHLDFPLVTVNRILSARFNLVTLDSKVNEEHSDSRKYSEVIRDRQNATPSDAGLFTDDKNNLFKFLSELSSKEKFIIESRFGFDGGECQTLEMIGNQLGLTRERVRQIEMLAMRKLRFRYKRKYGEMTRQ